MPVTTSPPETCPASCPLIGDGCYGLDFHLRMVWEGKDHSAKIGAATYLNWGDLCNKVRALPEGSLWRHNQAGDLPGLKRDNELINGALLHRLSLANQGRRGFTFTHKKPELGNNKWAIQRANDLGFIVNMSADDLDEADRFKELQCGPVVVTVPSNWPKVSWTPMGRKVVICPAQQNKKIQCVKCGLCAKKDRAFIIGFRAHGQKMKELDLRLKVLN
jgi:hypothetical protein